MLKVNVMPRNRTTSRRSVEVKLGYVIITALAIFAIFWIIYRSWYAGPPTLVQECYDQGGSEAVETRTGQVMCLKGNTILWRK